ncbi:hypothetical protein ACVWZ6_003265 [Bradyrhizobium sp. GM6.1]
MWNNGLGSARGILRSLLLALALAVVSWSATVLPTFRRMAPVTAIAERIIADDRFRTGALADVLLGIETDPVSASSMPGLTRAKALVRLRLAEDAMSRKSSEEADREVATAEDNVRLALALNPGDSFLWLMLYSVETARNGFNPGNLTYLDRSYAAGPHEGWVALRRNRLALAIFPMFQDSTQKTVVSEFSEMVDSDLIEEAATTLMGIGWPHRNRLLAALSEVDVASKKGLRKRLAADGINVRIPGIEYDERPWR